MINLIIMNATLEQIKPETIELLEKQAAKFGLSVDDYLRRLLPSDERELALKPNEKDNEFQNDMNAFTEGTENLSEYNGTYSREDIYFDRD